MQPFESLVGLVCIPAFRQMTPKPYKPMEFWARVGGSHRNATTQQATSVPSITVERNMGTRFPFLRGIPLRSLHGIKGLVLTALAKEGELAKNGCRATGDWGTGMLNNIGTYSWSLIGTLPSSFCAQILVCMAPVPRA